MIEGPLGAAAFNNEFGRPNLTGYFRTYEQDVEPTASRCAATTSRSCSPAAWATSSAEQSFKEETFPVGHAVRDWVAPAMLIGLGGGAASSMTSGVNRRRPRLRLGAARQPGDGAPCQEVIDRCWQLGDGQPDPVDPRRGCRRSLQCLAGAGQRRRPRWPGSTCARCRSTSRACARWKSGATNRRSATCWRLRRTACRQFKAMCERERCPFAVIGEATDERPPDPDRRPLRRSIRSICRMEVLLGKPPTMHRDVTSQHAQRRGASMLVGVDAEGRRRSRAAPADHGRQDLPHHHRRPLRRRPDRARPDGRPVAGAGGRRAP